MEINDIENENNGLDLSQSKKKAEEPFVVPAIEKSHDLYFNKVTELQAGDVIVSALCKFCNHPLRTEAEAKWETTKGAHGPGSYAQVYRFLNEKVKEMEAPNNTKFAYPSVINHLSNHYEQQQKRMWLREYGTHLSDIMNYKIAKEQSFELIKQSLQLKFFETAADPHLDAPKQVDMMSKLTKSILDVEVVAAKLRGDIDTIDVYKQKFQGLIVALITDEKDKDKRREYLEKVDRFKDEIVQ